MGEKGNILLDQRRLPQNSGCDRLVNLWAARVQPASTLKVSTATAAREGCNMQRRTLPAPHLWVAGRYKRRCEVHCAGLLRHNLVCKAWNGREPGARYARGTRCTGLRRTAGLQSPPAIANRQCHARIRAHTSLDVIVDGATHRHSLPSATARRGCQPGPRLTKSGRGTRRLATSRQGPAAVLPGSTPARTGAREGRTARSSRRRPRVEHPAPAYAPNVVDALTFQTPVFRGSIHADSLFSRNVTRSAERAEMLKSPRPSQ